MTEPSPETSATRLRLGIAYDGGAFNGWAKQPTLRTVQGTLEEAIWTIFGRRGDPVVITVAGRTDAGVHALGQVAHVDLSGTRMLALSRPRGPAGSTQRTPLDAFVRRVNGALGRYSDVVVSSAEVAATGFDARFSAVWRRYRYRVADPVAFRSPIARAHTAWHTKVLNLELMREASAVLVGLHDFAAYCKPKEGATTIRTLVDFDWRHDDDGVLIADVRADAFCHSMVRALVGACVAVGDGRLTVDDVVRLRDGLTRTNEFAVMPARGLTLVEVGYPEDALLGVRAELTRARRSLPPASGRDISPA